MVNNQLICNFWCKSYEDLGNLHKLFNANSEADFNKNFYYGMSFISFYIHVFGI